MYGINLKLKFSGLLVNFQVHFFGCDRQRQVIASTHTLHLFTDLYHRIRKKCVQVFSKTSGRLESGMETAS